MNQVPYLTFYINSILIWTTELASDTNIYLIHWMQNVEKQTEVDWASHMQTYIGLYGFTLEWSMSLKISRILLWIKTSVYCQSWSYSLMMLWAKSSLVLKLLYFRGFCDSEYIFVQFCTTSLQMLETTIKYHFIFCIMIWFTYIRITLPIFLN